jgi:hypothetical protein
VTGNGAVLNLSRSFANRGKPNIRVASRKVALSGLLIVAEQKLGSNGLWT